MENQTLLFTFFSVNIDDLWTESVVQNEYLVLRTTRFVLTTSLRYHCHAMTRAFNGKYKKRNYGRQCSSYIIEKVISKRC